MPEEREEINARALLDDTFPIFLFNESDFATAFASVLSEASVVNWPDPPDFAQEAIRGRSEFDPLGLASARLLCNRIEATPACFASLPIFLFKARANSRRFR